MNRDFILSSLNEIEKLGAKSPKETGSNPYAYIASMVGDLFNACLQYCADCEQHEKRREEIRAQKEVAIEKIRAQADEFRHFLTQAFAERARNFDRGFALLDEALRTGNDKGFETALTLIVTLIKESPIRQAQEVMRLIRERQPGQVVDL